ncbi:MAG: isoaspartyl peptidase/L-asparaginase [Ignavibacteriales bacterium]|nr:isoaspartyl peptidase/L-asparaginase [Ignavibacteriales bacterium]
MIQGLMLVKELYYTSEGKHELDASIMQGRDLIHAVRLLELQMIKNPISLSTISNGKNASMFCLPVKALMILAIQMSVDIVPNSLFSMIRQIMNNGLIKVSTKQSRRNSWLCGT